MSFESDTSTTTRVLPKATRRCNVQPPMERQTHSVDEDIDNKKTFERTAEYDDAIGGYMKRQFAGGGMQHLDLKYGMNPHQTPAELKSPSAQNMPVKILNGSPGYINLLDALNSWQLVKELYTTFDVPAAASFKHVSPAGAAIFMPLSEAEAIAYQMEDMMDKLAHSPVAIAYVRARGADRVSSYGDFIALSHRCDEPTARMIAREVSDGIIAPEFDDKAVEILAKKKNKNYCILQIDPTFEPSATEERTVFGLKLKQKRNDVVIDEKMFSNIVSESKELPDTAQRDLIIATIALKYAQSNSVCCAKNGQVVGMGTGQQSRIHCTKLAAQKCYDWWQRQHPRLRSLPFKATAKRSDRANAIDAIVTGEDDFPFEQFLDQPIPEPLKMREKKEWAKSLTDVVLSSDAFFPFRDNIDRAVKCGVRYIASPGGSANDDTIVRACNEHHVTLVHTGVRLFTH